MVNAVLISRARRVEITSAIALATRLWWLLLAAGVASMLLFRPQTYLPSVLLFAAGLGSSAVLFLSWHYYRPRVSIYAWLLFSAAIAISIATGLVLPTVREGALHPLGGLFAMTGCFGAGIAAPLVVFAPRLRKWASE